MTINPAAAERKMRVESQLLFWLGGKSLHNGQAKGRGKCCPDFSCCDKRLSMTLDGKIKLTLSVLKERLIEHIRSSEVDYGEELDIESQELICAWIEKWFDNLSFDTI